MTLDMLLIEDDQDLAATVIQFLNIEGIRCDHAGNGLQGLTLSSQHRYDVILLDLNLPRLDGISLCQRLRQAGNDTPVLMLTARDQLADKLEGFSAGTDDFLVKPFELQELLVRVQALARRRSGQVRLLHYADLSMDIDRRQVSRAGHTLKLSPTGWRLLETLLRHAPAVVSRQALEEAVWSDELPDSNSLKVHMFHLRKAVDGGFAVSLLRTVPGHGFALNEGGDEKPTQP